MGRAASLLVLAVALASGAPVLAGDWLVYAVTSKGQAFMAEKTEIFAVDPDSGKRAPIFSDEHAPIRIVEQLYVFHWPVIAGGRLFAHAVERGRVPPHPGNGALYELRTDGSNGARKIADIVSDESLGDLVAEPDGRLIGYFARRGRQQLFVEVDTATGQEVHRVDLTRTIRDCLVASAGWLRGGGVFFTIEVVDVDAVSPDSEKQVGTYRMDEDGRNLRRVRVIPGAPQDAQRMLGVAADGAYLYEDAGIGGGTSMTKVDPVTGKKASVGFRAAAVARSSIRLAYCVSRSGDQVAATKVTSTMDSAPWVIWVRSIPQGSEKEAVSIPTAGMNGPFVGIVGWSATGPSVRLPLAAGDLR
jgi:hypothetical protein